MGKAFEGKKVCVHREREGISQELHKMNLKTHRIKCTAKETAIEVPQNARRSRSERRAPTGEGFTPRAGSKTGDGERDEREFVCT